ncbi:MAG: sulfatase [Acidobacteriota bacterium]
MADREESSPALPGPANIFLLTIDTLRADRLSSYGYVRNTSPNLDRLAAEGVRFDRPAVQWPKTGPSFASIFTSTYPSQNNIVRHVGIELPCEFRMLAEELQARGYATYAVVANGAVASDFRFDQGFDRFIETWKIDPPPAGLDPNGAEAVNLQTELLLDEIDPSQPYFLWVHYLDPHFPYEPPEAVRDRFQDDEHFDPSIKIPITDNPNQQIVKLGRARMLDGRDELAFYEARYDAEIHYVDDQVGRLMESMEQRGLLDGTLTAFTSDHGESLGEHLYYFDHGRFGFQTCARVPLVLHYPEAFGPRVVDEPVGLIDLAPTLLEAAGAQLKNGVWGQGRSLVPYLFSGERAPLAPHDATADGVLGTGADAEDAADFAAADWVAPAGMAFTEAGFASSRRWQHWVQDARFKLVYTQAFKEQRFIGGGGQKFVLYDLESDPGETRDVSAEHPDTVERLKRVLWRQFRAASFPVRSDAESCGGQGEMGEETEALLRSLGYL